MGSARVIGTRLPVLLLLAGALSAGACSNQSPAAAAAPAPDPERGEYLTMLLGCGQCHTEGALLGEPAGPWLAGSRIGVAYTADEHDANPGVVFPKNLTPDPETGLGNWSESDIVAAISSGFGHSGETINSVMPWMNYSLVTEEDLFSIARYLKRLRPVRNLLPANVEPGEPVTAPYIRIGLYVFTPNDAED